MSESAHHAPAPVPQPAPVYKIVDISTVKRQGDTWLLNSQLTYTDSQNFSSVHFISNGQSFTAISHFPKGNSECLYYKDPEDTKLYKCERIGEAVGGKIVLQYLPHELVGNYFTAV